ncbi:MAG TPA: DUF222 domain-containing protein, partial [Candidatus Dormibacteraeota bacterium]
MSAELEDLEAAITDFELADDDLIDPKRLSSAIDRLQAKQARVLHRCKQRGDWQLARVPPATWAARQCGMSRHQAADRLCVGKQLESLPEVAGALGQGEIGYQAVSAVCHLRERLGDRWPAGLESDLVRYARQFTV